MSAIRRLAALLLLVTLPVYGLASVGGAGVCPAQAASQAMDHHAGHMAMHDGGDHAMPGHDCCDPAAQADQPVDSSYHAGGNCKTCCHVYQPPVAAAVALMHAASETVLVMPSLSFVSCDADGLWRPPRSV